MTEVITSSQNNNIKLAASLKQKKYRDEKHLFVAEGIRLVEDAVNSNWQIEFCIHTEQAAENERVQKIVKNLEKKECRIYQVNKAIYEKITDTKEPQGILVILKKQASCLDDFIIEGKVPMLIVLDRLQDPGNVGTIVRTAEAAGCTGIIMMKGTADLFSSKTVRATMGAMFRFPIVVDVDFRDLLKFIEKQAIQLQVTALDPTAKQYFAIDFTKPTAMVFGNEGNGVSEELLQQADHKVYIPMSSNAESLNVAAATAVIIYESVRQRLLKSGE